MRDVELIVCPFGKEILRELSIDEVIFHQEHFDHVLSFGMLKVSGTVASSLEKYSG